MSTSVAAEVALAPEQGDNHASAPLSLITAPNGTLAATGFVLERPRLRRRVDAAMIRTLDALVAAVLLLVLRVRDQTPVWR